MARSGLDQAGDVARSGLDQAGDVARSGLDSNPSPKHKPKPKPEPKPKSSPSPLTLTREAADKVAEAVSPATDAVKSVWEEVTGWLKG